MKLSVGAIRKYPPYSASSKRQKMAGLSKSGRHPQSTDPSGATSTADRQSPMTPLGIDWLVHASICIYNGVPTFLPRRNPAKGPALSWTELSGSGKPVG